MTRTVASNWKPWFGVLAFRIVATICSDSPRGIRGRVTASAGK
ncbi:MAG TPA: hypothetical protein VFA98_00020 [Thermoanaerobaculia bacterium]|nr:hypothetical protein [Thermoanaerobaculia bacterium]